MVLIKANVQKKNYNPENYYNGSVSNFYLSGIIHIFVGYKNRKTSIV